MATARFANYDHAGHSEFSNLSTLGSRYFACIPLANFFDGMWHGHCDPMVQERNPTTKSKNRKEVDMKKEITFLIAFIWGGTVGLAPMPSWAQEAPGESRQPFPEQTRPGENEGIPGMHGGGTQELSKNDMRAIEQALEEKGYNVGRVDGTADDSGRAAIRKFQQDEGIPITGMIDERTAHRLGFGMSSQNPSGGAGGRDRPAPSEPPAYR